MFYFLGYDTTVRVPYNDTSTELNTNTTMIANSTHRGGMDTLSSRLIDVVDRTAHYEWNYSHKEDQNQRMEMFLLGMVSLALTIVNIICIIFTGWAILRIKEVTPQKIPQQFSSFWTKDVKVHRDYMKTIDRKKANHTLLDETREALGIANTGDAGLENTFLHTLYDKVEQESDYINITQWKSTPKDKMKHRMERQKRTEAVNEPKEITDDTTYLRHKRTQSVRQGVLNRRLHNQAKMLVRQSLETTNFDIQNEAVRPRNVTFSDGVVGEKKMRRARKISFPPNTNNITSTARNANNRSGLGILEEEKLIDNTNKNN